MIEVVVATAVLSLGLIIVSQGLLMNLQGFNYSIDYLNVLLWMDWKFWQAHDNLTHYKTLLTDEVNGSFRLRNRDFRWDLSYHLVEGTDYSSLYELVLRVFWKEGVKDASALRSGYVLHILSKE